MRNYYLSQDSMACMGLAACRLGWLPASRVPPLPLYCYHLLLLLYCSVYECMLCSVCWGSCNVCKVLAFNWGGAMSARASYRQTKKLYFFVVKTKQTTSSKKKKNFFLKWPTWLIVFCCCSAKWFAAAPLMDVRYVIT